MSAPTWAAVAVLGGIGAVARFMLDRTISSRSASQLPGGTLLVNASGAFALGLLIGVSVSGTSLLLAGTATIGSYTTFSTWMFETHRLGEDGEIGRAALNLLASAGIGLAAVALGRLIGRSL